MYLTRLMKTTAMHNRGNVMNIIARWDALPKGSNARTQLYKDLSQALIRLEKSNEIPFDQGMNFVEWVKLGELSLTCMYTIYC